MKKTKYSSTDMAALISEVETRFDVMFKSQTESNDLQKSEIAEQPAQEAQPVETAQESGIGYDEGDIKEMNDMYSSMTKAEAELHFEALKNALSKETQEVVAQPQAEETVAKSEVKPEEKSAGTEETKLLKSEIETLKSEKEKLEKSFKEVAAKLVEFVKGSKAPKQKAITQLQYVAKSEDEQKPESQQGEDVSKLGQSEISKRLTAQIRSGKLEKSEREKITNFYQNGSKNIESIRHLLTGGN